MVELVTYSHGHHVQLYGSAHGVHGAHGVQGVHGGHGGHGQGSGVGSAVGPAGGRRRSRRGALAAEEAPRYMESRVALEVKIQER